MIAREKFDPSQWKSAPVLRSTFLVADHLDDKSIDG